MCKRVYANVCRALWEDDIRMAAELAQAGGDIEAANVALDSNKQRTTSSFSSPVTQVYLFVLLFKPCLL
jgi:hypothetical protein